MWDSLPHQNQSMEVTEDVVLFFGSGQHDEPTPPPSLLDTWQICTSVTVTMYLFANDLKLLYITFDI